MRPTLIIAGFVVLAGCFRSPAPYRGPAPAGADASPYVGCYEVRHVKPEEWRINNQWKLRLDSALSQSTTPGTRGGPGVRQATTSRSGDVAVEWWLIPGGIQLHAGNSLHGQYIEFYPRADSLVGRTYDYADTRNGFTTDPLSAHRTACPS